MCETWDHHHFVGSRVAFGSEIDEHAAQKPFVETVPLSRLVEITPKTHDAVIALAYATPENFTGKPVYAATAGCYLHEDADAHLRRAIDLAARLGLRFKIFDA